MHKNRTTPEPPAVRPTRSPIFQMKVIVWWILLFAGVLGVLTPRLFAQDAASLNRPQARSSVMPLKDVSPDTIRALATSGASIPLWDYKVTSPLNGHVYSGSMVGRSPFYNGARTTDVPTIIVPLKIKFSDGTVFDPTATDSGCSPAGTPLNLTENSPIFTPVDIAMNGVDMGVTQYGDAFQRANFWTDVSVTGDRYHTMLGPVTVLAAVTVNVPAASGSMFSDTQFGGCGGIIGVMNINWFDPYVRGTILPGLAGSGVNPTVLPMLLMKNVVMVDGTPTLDGNCCIVSYHGAYGSPLQTYTPVDYDTSGIFIGLADINAITHEVSEWMDDPTGTNPTPAWGHTGQVTGCQSNLEVADPLSDNEFPPLLGANGFAYHPQELAFFSWFYRQSPSLGVDAMYSNNGTFTHDAGAACL
jgi:hypothetical protein